jgi:hypothetical protein
MLNTMKVSQTTGRTIFSISNSCSLQRGLIYRRCMPHSGISGMRCT